MSTIQKFPAQFILTNLNQKTLGFYKVKGLKKKLNTQHFFFSQRLKFLPVHNEISITMSLVCKGYVKKTIRFGRPCSK